MSSSNRNKFKIGDKVRVIRIAKSRENGWDNSWVPGMNDYVGRVFKILKKDTGKGVCLGDEHWNFPEFVLEPEIKSGDQLLFNFMED